MVTIPPSTGNFSIPWAVDGLRAALSWKQCSYNYVCRALHQMLHAVDVVDAALSSMDCPYSMVSALSLGAFSCLRSFVYLSFLCSSPGDPSAFLYQFGVNEAGTVGLTHWCMALLLMIIIVSVPHALLFWKCAL
ncbi:hypothetical protein Tco_0740371 [Tanacetum coccineum]